MFIHPIFWYFWQKRISGLFPPLPLTPKKKKVKQWQERWKSSVCCLGPEVAPWEVEIKQRVFSLPFFAQTKKKQKNKQKQAKSQAVVQNGKKVMFEENKRARKRTPDRLWHKKSGGGHLKAPMTDAARSSWSLLSKTQIELKWSSRPIFVQQNALTTSHASTESIFSCKSPCSAKRVSKSPFGSHFTAQFFKSSKPFQLFRNPRKNVFWNCLRFVKSGLLMKTTITQMRVTPRLSYVNKVWLRRIKLFVSLALFICWFFGLFWPSNCVSMPSKTLKSVDFPAPFTPRTATCSLPKEGWTKFGKTLVQKWRTFETHPSWIAKRTLRKRYCPVSNFFVASLSWRTMGPERSRECSVPKKKCIFWENWESTQKEKNSVFTVQETWSFKPKRSLASQSRSKTDVLLVRLGFEHWNRQTSLSDWNNMTTKSSKEGMRQHHKAKTRRCQENPKHKKKKNTVIKL